MNSNIFYDKLYCFIMNFLQMPFQSVGYSAIRLLPRETKTNFYVHS